VDRPLIWLSGADPEILAAHTVDRNRYFGMGCAILITGTLAGVSMWVALHTALGLPALNAVPFALVWAMIIMAIDRWLVASLKRRDDWKAGRYFRAASPRLAMAVLFGFIISTPLTLWIFHSEIQYQLTLSQQHATYEYFHGKTREQLVAMITQDSDAVASLSIQSRTGGPGIDLSKDLTLQKLEKQLAAEEQLENTYYYQWQCQLYGVAGGGQKCMAGTGVLAATAEKRYDNAVSQVASDERLVQAREALLEGQSTKQRTATRILDKNNLAGAKKTLATNKKLLAQDDADFFSANKADTGLLARIRALDQASAGDAVLEVSRWLFFLFLVVIDCLPVLVKVGNNLGPEDEYEQAVKATEQDRRDITTARQANRKKDELSRSAARDMTRDVLATAEEQARKQIRLHQLQRRVAKKTRSAPSPRRWSRTWRRTGSSSRLGSPGSAAGGTPETFLREYRPPSSSATRNGGTGADA
jgi:hypothetical protein